VVVTEGDVIAFTHKEVKTKLFFLPSPRSTGERGEMVQARKRSAASVARSSASCTC